MPRYESWEVTTSHPKHKQLKVSLMCKPGEDPLVIAFERSHELRTVPMSFTTKSGTFTTKYIYRRK